MVLPFGQDLFRTVPEFLANFDFNDIASNTGVVNFFGSGSILTDTKLEQYPGNANVTEDREMTTVPFKRSRRIHGTPYVSIPIYAFRVSSGGTNPNVAITALKLVKIAKDDSETDITTTITGGSIEQGNNTTLSWASNMVAWAEVNNVLIKTGEKVKLKFTSTVGGTNGGAGFTNNPNGTLLKAERIAGSSVTSEDVNNTALVVAIPFKLDI